MDCLDVLDLMSGALDNELSQEELMQFNAHLEECSSCHALYRELQRMHIAVETMPLMEAPQDLKSNIMAKIAQETPMIPFHRRPWVKQCISTAACLALCLGVFQLVSQKTDPHTAASMPREFPPPSAPSTPVSTSGGVVAEDFGNSTEADMTPFTMDVPDQEEKRSPVGGNRGDMEASSIGEPGENGAISLDVQDFCTLLGVESVTLVTVDALPETLPQEISQVETWELWTDTPYCVLTQEEADCLLAEFGESFVVIQGEADAPVVLVIVG